MDWNGDIAGALDAVRAQRPLVHNITNYVAMNATANALLAIGASPVMAHAIEEVEDLVDISNALVLNIGTLSRPWIEAMLRAGMRARETGRPVVLDPVGAGASRFRTETARDLVSQVRPTILRANASEILALGDATGGARGVDARHTVEQARLTAVRLARTLDRTVSVSGAEDYITNGRIECRIRNGHPLMSRITGSGCVASAVTGAFAAVASEPILAAASALVVLGLAGEWAAQQATRPGSYAVALIDGLDAITPDAVRAGARIEVREVTG